MTFQVQARSSTFHKIYDEELWCVDKHCMFEYTLLFASRKRVKSIFSKLNSESFEFQSVSTVNHHDTF